MALPGGVIVYLDGAMPLEATSTWLRERRLTVVDRLATDARGFIVESEPGLAALELAERLRREPGVRSATPLWWRETAPR